jgi:L-alanine-DL-glutamate epimerase-like enolase superfamily enzyme
MKERLMKISDVRCVIFDWTPPVHAFKGAIARVLGDRKSVPHMIVRVMTDEGVEGNSSQYVVGQQGLAEHIETRMKPRLMGKDPTDVEFVWQDLWRFTRSTHSHKFILGAIEVCLWDILAKVAHLPLYKLLGAYRDKVPAYASSQGCATIEETVEEALEYKERGYPAYKIHLHDMDRPNPKYDLELAKALRKNLGEDYGLMHDPASMYTREEALYVGLGLQELGFEWYEEPINQWDIEGYAQLCQALHLPIAGIETVDGSLFSTPEYIIRRAADMILTDVRMKGGIGPVRKTAAMAEAFGMPCLIHACASPLFNVANLHVLSSIKNCKYYEALIPAENFSAGVVEDIYPDKQGTISPPKKPGLGLEIDWPYVEKHKIYETK